jgi:uncharacterized pyridoxal phosphate-containing UPF0001 family protein
VRTTYWTRKQRDKRPDESDDFTSELDLKNQIYVESAAELNEENPNEQENPVASSKRKRFYRVLLNVLCGFDKQDENKAAQAKEDYWPEEAELGNRLNGNLSKQKHKEAKRRYEIFHSLLQSKFERYILNVNLVIIISIAVVLYIFFSIPLKYHIFKHISLNSTRNSHS